MATTVNLDTSQRVDIICKRGDTFSLRVTMTDSDGDASFAVGDTFLMQVRDADTNDTSTVLEITPSAAIQADVDNKYIDFTKAAASMKALTSGLYVYDIEQNSSGTISTLIYGTFKVNEDVSITSP